MGNKRQALTEDQRRHWADLGQMALLDALMSQSAFRADQISFHGGTSLHLCWNSPRFSEDLDFMTSHKDPHGHLTKIMPRIAASMDRFFLRHEPGLSAELKDRTKESDRMIVFEARLSHEQVVGKSKVKMEFWRVNQDYLNQYEDELRLPTKGSSDLVAHIQSSMPVSTATKETILGDKMVAIAFRDYVKWRDIFDIWWLDQQTGGLDINMLGKNGESLIERAARQAMAYEGPGLKAGLDRFISMREDLLSGKNCNLDTFLPERLTIILMPRIDEIAGVAIRYAEAGRAAIDSLDDETLLKYGSSVEGVVDIAPPKF